jgi:DNA-binding phage protein
MPHVNRPSKYFPVAQMPQRVHDLVMDLDEIKRRLSALQERELMSDFASRSGINRRTLQRIMLADEHKQGPHPATMSAIKRTLGQRKFSPAAPEQATTEQS